MAKFRATKKGYYGDVIRDPDGPHAVFEAADDFQCSWAEKVGDDTPVVVAQEVSEETVEAEAILDAEADAAKEDEPIDVNEETGVETL